MCALELKVLVHLTRQCSASAQSLLAAQEETQERTLRTRLRLAAVGTEYRERLMLKRGSLPQAERQVRHLAIKEDIWTAYE